jgi:hypothetical protein
MIPIRCVAFAVLLLLSGCAHRVPEATIVVIDTSLSITPRAEKEALDAVQEQIANIRRGDILVIIPITGDAANDSGGRVLRLSAPIQREPYDADLRRFQEHARKQFVAWAASLDTHQSRTDILGALEVARQEFAVLPNHEARRLIVFSDFLEDDGTYRFVSAGELTSPASARQLAARLREQRGFTLQGVHLCLGRLESIDFAPLSPQRKDAVQAFWTAYFVKKDRTPEIQFDGVGMVSGADGQCSGGKP